MLKNCENNIFYISLHYMTKIELLGSAVLAGVAISLGCIAFLSIGGVIGAVLFTFGLLTVIHYKLSLYTGTCGFVELFSLKRNISQGWQTILLIILGNAIGCLLTALLTSVGGFSFGPSLLALMDNRMSLSLLEIFVRAIGCGFIMTTVVKFAREGRFLPLLFGIPLFICCGFLHSIADTFYYSLASIIGGLNYHWNIGLVSSLATTYLGNYVGCNAHKIFLTKKMW